MVHETAIGADADANLRALGDVITAAMAHYHVPGVAVGILHEGREHYAGFGVTSVENPLPVTTDTLFQIGSITKTFTGTVAMRLVETGKLDLDAPVRTYLPNLRLADEGAAAAVTMRHLLNHTGGWVGDYFDDTGAGDDALERIVERMVELPQLTPLGQVWSYNNAGFYIAGRVIEVLTGQPYETVVRDLIFAPLGMTKSIFFASDAITERTAVGHIVRDGVPEVARPWPLARAAHPAGGIASTVCDMLRYARFQLGDDTSPAGARLLTRASLDLMQAPATPAGSANGATGIAWMVRHSGGVKLVRHSGGTHGQLSVFVMAPERDFAIAVLTNASRGGELHGDVVKWALGRYLGIEEAAPEPLTVPAADLVPYAGRYSAAADDQQISVRDGGLWLQSYPHGGFPYKDSPPGPTPPPVRLALLDDDRAIALDEPLKGARGEFLRGSDGAIAWLRFGGRIARRQE
ncbi:MAG: serine hydrolase domain-containing protein [Thermomicrobiales bacterium]